MKIICHRGLWKTKREQNSLRSCMDAGRLFDGMEIDLKNLNGEIVLSHDPIKRGESPLPLKNVFKLNQNTFYALNIKEDGLGPRLLSLLKAYGIKNYMCFDLSVPEKLQYQKLGLQVFQRFGDHDFLLEKSFAGLVVDVFNQRKYSKVFAALTELKRSRPLFFISPELHHQKPHTNWKKMKALINDLPSQSYLCTDLPEEAAKFFH